MNASDIPWKHRPECTAHQCYCADPDGESDPVCECGRPGWACVCYDQDDPWDDTEDDDGDEDDFLPDGPADVLTE